MDKFICIKDILFKNNTIKKGTIHHIDDMKYFIWKIFSYYEHQYNEYNEIRDKYFMSMSEFRKNRLNKILYE